MYFSQCLCSEIRYVDKIVDLPVNYSKYLTNRRPESVQSRSASSSNLYEQYQAPPPQFTQTEPVRQVHKFPSSYTTTYRSSYTAQNANRFGGSQLGLYTKYA